VLEAYDLCIGLELTEVAVDGRIIKAPCGGEKAGRSPADRRKQGTKRSTAVDARGIPIGTVTAPANCHDSPLLTETLDAVAETLGELPEQMSAHLDRWASRAAYEAFRARWSSEYRRLDRRLEELTEEEAPLGAFEALP
jgi:hypothetical protein